jgi:hypothetical protein
MHRFRAIGGAATWMFALMIATAVPAGAADATGAPQPGQEAVRPGSSAPAAQQGPPQGMMMCPMMAGMGGGTGMMGGMGMSGMNMSGMTMSHGTGTGTTLTDMAQNVSLRDLAQLLQELLVIQEQTLAALPQQPTAEVRRDLARLKTRSSDLLSEIKAMVSAAARGE